MCVLMFTWDEFKTVDLAGQRLCTLAGVSLVVPHCPCFLPNPLSTVQALPEMEPRRTLLLMHL